jgi:quercetin dioxygenase-like cupin family protein
MFGAKSSLGYQKILEGIKIKTINYGKDMIMTEFLLSKGSALPEHRHINEQTGYLVKGKIRLHIDEKSKIIESGDSWNIASNIKHKAEILEDSIAIEIFNPVREDYLKFILKEDITE